MSCVMVSASRLRKRSGDNSKAEFYLREGQTFFKIILRVYGVSGQQQFGSEKRATLNGV